MESRENTEERGEEDGAKRQELGKRFSMFLLSLTPAHAASGAHYKHTSLFGLFIKIKLIITNVSNTVLSSCNGANKCVL